jgi:hypothetical protein
VKHGVGGIDALDELGVLRGGEAGGQAEGNESGCGKMAHKR